MNALRRWIWVAWLPVAIALAMPAFREQIARAGARPALAIAGLIAIAASIPIWLMLRSRWPRIELPLLFFLAIAPPLWRHPVAAAVTVVTFFAVSGFGRWVLDWMNLSTRHRATELVFSAGIGLAAWMIVLLGLGLAHLFRAPVIAAVLTFAIILCRNGVAKIARAFGEAFKDWTAPGAWAGVHTMFLGITIVVLQPVVIAPSILYDALATHLASSRSFSLHHAIPPPGGYDFLPQGFELMMGAADILGGQPAEQMMAPLFLALFWLAVYAIARETGATRDTSLGAATLALAIPFIQWTGAIVKNDIGAAFFLLAALLAYLAYLRVMKKGTEHSVPASKPLAPHSTISVNRAVCALYDYPHLHSTARRATRWILAGSFLCAGAENIKHTALVGIAPLALLFLIAACRDREHRFQTIVLASAIFFIFGGFWMVRAAWIQGDPFYPLRSPGAMEPMAPAAFHSIADRFAFLVRLQFSGVPIFEGNSTTRLGPLFLLFLPAIFWIKRSDFNRGNLAIFFFTVVYLGIWLCTWPVLRYAAAPIALAAAGVAVGIGRVIQASPKWLGSILIASIALCYLLNVANLSGMCLNAARVKYFARLANDDQYLRASLPSYAAIAWTRDHAPKGTLIFAAGTHALAYAADPVLFASPFPEQGPFSPAAIRHALAEAHYGYAILPAGVDVFGPQNREFADANFAVYRLP